MQNVYIYNGRKEVFFVGVRGGYKDSEEGNGWVEGG